MASLIKITKQILLLRHPMHSSHRYIHGMTVPSEGEVTCRHAAKYRYKKTTYEINSCLFGAALLSSFAAMRVYGPKYVMASAMPYHRKSIPLAKLYLPLTLTHENLNLLHLESCTSVWGYFPISFFFLHFI